MDLLDGKDTTEYEEGWLEATSWSYHRVIEYLKRLDQEHNTKGVLKVAIAEIQSWEQRSRE